MPYIDANARDRIAAGATPTKAEQQVRELLDALRKIAAIGGVSPTLKSIARLERENEAWAAPVSDRKALHSAWSTFEEDQKPRSPFESGWAFEAGWLAHARHERASRDVPRDEHGVALPSNLPHAGPSGVHKQSRHKRGE